VQALVLVGWATSLFPGGAFSRIGRHDLSSRLLEKAEVSSL
jgi:hypothetical protein